jgi:tripartite-type tricarboxylate transporter receptor subunit TctC
MKEPLVKMLNLLAVCGALAGATGPAHAQGYPSKPIRLVTPAPTGSGVDIVSRLLAQRLVERWNQQVVVDDRPGGGGVAGSDLVAKAPPDGYTLLMASTAHVTNPGLRPTMPYDTLNDFAPVSMVALVSSVLVVHPSLPVKSVRDLIAFAKTHPDELTFASVSGSGSTYLPALLFNSMAGVAMMHVPYKAGGAALNELLSGQVSLMFGNMALTVQHARAGRLRALAVTGARRAAAVPELPTIAEAGLPGYEATGWFALLAPAKTSGTVINKLNSEVVAIMQQPEVKERMTTVGAEAISSTPGELGSHLRAELIKWSKVIKEVGAQAE